MSNGRCFRHGGKTPRGDQWHLRQWPNRKSANAMQKMNWKLHHAEKEAAERKRRTEFLPKAKREAHRKWQATHKPGPAKARAADRERRRQDRAARADIQRIQIQLAIENGEGVFG